MLSPRLDWALMATAVRRVAVCVQSLPDFDRRFRLSPCFPGENQLAVNAQKAKSAEVTQRTIPLEMWIDTKSRRSCAFWLLEMREPT